MTVQTYPAPKSQVTSSFWRYTATGGETTLSGVDNAGVTLAYYPNQEQVHLNGIMLVRGVDYTATNGTSIVGLAALAAGDNIQVNCYSNFTITQIPVTSLQGSVTNLQLANSTFTIGSTLFNLGDTKTTLTGLTLTSPTINNPVVGTGYSTSTPLVVKGAAGQAVNLQEWNINGGTPVAYISASGAMLVSGSITMPNNNNNTTNRLYLAGSDSNHSIYSTGSGGNNMYFNEYGNFYFYNTQYSLEYLRIDPNGSTIFGGLDPATYNPNSSYNRTLSVRQSDQVLTMGSYWQAGVGQNSYINSSQSTSATNASDLLLQTGQTTKMIITAGGKIGIGTTAPDKKLTLEGGDFNLGWMRSWNIGQPTNAIVSGGTNVMRLWVNKGLSQNYYRGFIFEVFGGGGLDWGGNGLTTYYGKFMVTFESTSSNLARVHLIQEYGRSYLNNTGTEITYNTYSLTNDANYLYVTINFKGVNASAGYKPLFSVITYDPGNGGSSSMTASNNQVYNVVAV
jgi:hypothetical protein